MCPTTLIGITPKRRNGWLLNAWRWVEHSSLMFVSELISSYQEKKSLFVSFTLGVDPTESHPVYCAARQFASAAVCWETGEDPSLCHQREGSDNAGPGQHLGRTGTLQCANHQKYWVWVFKCLQVTEKKLHSFFNVKTFSAKMRTFWVKKNPLLITSFFQCYTFISW